jgi:outer membrane protein assembly factor BamE (lipoprotein component of BamABCDE complex)
VGAEQAMLSQWHNKWGTGNMHFKHGKSIKSFLAFVALAAITACAATYSSHGYVPTDLEMENILVGTDTRSTVEEIIGRPSSTGVLSGGAWYYMSSRVKYNTYHKPEVIERTILAVSFDENDTVSNIEKFGLEDGKVITLSRRVTDSGVKGTNFFRQLLNNFGNFTPSDLTGSNG